MRIARISTVPYFVASQLCRQVEYTMQAGADVTIITSAGPELDNMKERLPALHIVTMEIPRSISLLKDFKALINLYRILRSESFDIVHSTTPKAGLISAIAAKWAGVPIRLHTFTGQPWVNLSGPVRWLSRWSDWLIGKLNTRCYADSESQRKFLIEQRVVAKRDLAVIGAGSLAGVDLVRFDPTHYSERLRGEIRQALGIPNDAPVILFVGRITQDKGVHELLKAFEGMKAAVGQAHLVLVGPFDEALGGQRSTELNVDRIRDVHWVGYTDTPERYMSIATLLCLPSYREGFGTVVIEAAAMGVPTVGTDIYGLSDAIVNGETGILVPPRNAAVLAMALHDLLTDETKRSKMGSAAKLRAEKLFSADAINKKVVEEYCRLLSAKKGINDK